jgi:hypothetical protein
MDKEAQLNAITEAANAVRDNLRTNLGNALRIYRAGPSSGGGTSVLQRIEIASFPLTDSDIGLFDQRVFILLQLENPIDNQDLANNRVIFSCYFWSNANIERILLNSLPSVRLPRKGNHAYAPAPKSDWVFKQLYKWT